MNFAISLIVCFFINLICVRNAIIIMDPLIDRTFYPVWAQNSLSDKNKFNLHHGFVEEKSKWENGVVFYKIDRDFNQDEINEIKRAMEEIESCSCIHFKAHNESSDPGHYVLIRKYYAHNEYWRCGNTAIGCSNKGEQVMWLGRRCINLNNILGLLLQTLGFDHHQNRSDRDKYIRIHTENILYEEVVNGFNNFVKLINFDESVKYLTPFDFSSILLYGEYTTSKNNKAVITPKVDGVKMQALSSNSTLSKYDKILLNHFYECNEKNSTSKKSLDLDRRDNVDAIKKKDVLVDSGNGNGDSKESLIKSVKVALQHMGKIPISGGILRTVIKLTNSFKML